MTTVNLSIVFFLVSFLIHGQQILVPPYIQPGNTSTLSKEQKILVWQTDSIPGNYKVEISLAKPGQKKNHS